MRCNQDKRLQSKKELRLDQQSFTMFLLVVDSVRNIPILIEVVFPFLFPCSYHLLPWHNKYIINSSKETIHIQHIQPKSETVGHLKHRLKLSNLLVQKEKITGNQLIQSKP
ncbi:hypothetical protein QL285_075651 [Trifolium repens]|nr:hypothetical protein QL285_075651 [Trifolium repens]